NLIRALANDPQASLEKLKKAKAEGTTGHQQRHNARLALAALGMGDTKLAIDATEFEDRTDPGVRTWFIDELPRWEIDIEKLVDDVQESTFPALRSAICLGIGQKPVKQVNSAEIIYVSELASRWYWLADSSTHSAVTWLINRWGLRVPTLQDAPKMEEDPSWYVNEQGVTFVRVTPSSVELEPLPDLLGQYRRRLSEFKEKPDQEQRTAEDRYQLGTIFYALGQYEKALQEFDAVLKMPRTDPVENFGMDPHGYRLLTLARLKRSDETDLALAEWRATAPSPEVSIYTESVILRWLGRKAEANEKLKNALESNAISDRNTQYTLARTLACFATDDTATPEEKSEWTKGAIDILESWGDGSEFDRNKMRSELDFLALHSDRRFKKLTTLRSNAPEQPYWMANREVTRGEFEEFIEDTSSDIQKPNDRDESKLQFYDDVSPTGNHPVQNVSWYDAVLYCNWLSKKEGLTPVYRSVGKTKEVVDNIDEIEVDIWQIVADANGYRLPSELEWSYACRAGSNTEWNTGSDEKLLERYCQMFPSKQTSPSGVKLPNAWGLHDMHGNVWEWCWDQNPNLSLERVDCGGSWTDKPLRCRSGEQGGRLPWGRHSDRGFRIVRSCTGN
ncbi:MAG: SUMF1/EgtB/PvdO family nonheme iron enzyme, partial [Pirellula sp.]